MTREQIANRLALMGIVGVVAEADWPRDALAMDDDLAIQNLAGAALQEDSKYVAIYSGADLREQVGRY